MALRTKESAVRGVIETDSTVEITPFIVTANSIVDWLDTQDTEGLLNSNTLELIERYLAAHFYQANRDRNYQSKSTGRASGTFQGVTGKLLESTDPGQTALLLDVTGKLAELGKGVLRPSLLWLGTAEDSLERTDLTSE